MQIPPLCLGTMTFGSQADEKQSHRMLDLWLERGSNFVDTANVYNKGASEEIVGKWLAGQRRDRIILATKVRGKIGEGPLDVGLSRAAIVYQIEQSLKRLRTGYVDLYYLHQPDYDVPIEESLGAMDELIRAGKVREPAASNYAAWQMTEMQWIAKERGFAPIRVTQPMYNLLARGIEQEFLPMCQRFGIATAVYNPLAGGLLTGKHGASPEAGGRFDGNQMYLDRYWHDAMHRAVEHLRSAGRPLVSLALNWIRHHSAATSMILGASRIEQLEQNLAALNEGPLSEEQLRICDEAWAMVRGSAPKYNR
jgi:1-deoxyxylulose-5-phosphate synthase